MNQIALKIHAVEHSPGDNILGVVYLRIQSPTLGNGIRLKFYGFELVQFYEENKEKLLFNDIIHLNDLVIYKERVPLACGYYAIPFQLKIPENIPGSFFYMNHNNKWRATISYELHAEVIDADSVHVQRPILIVDSTSRNNGNEVINRDVKKRFSKHSIHIAASIDDEKILRCGDVCQVKVDVSSQSDARLQAIGVELRQTISTKRPQESNVGRHGDDFGPQVSYDDSTNVIRLDQLQSEILKTGSYTLLLKLSGDKDDIVPTTNGHIIRCTYVARVMVELRDRSKVRLDIPINRVLPNADYVTSADWKPPTWITLATVIPAWAPFTVLNELAGIDLDNFSFSNLSLGV